MNDGNDVGRRLAERAVSRNAQPLVSVIMPTYRQEHFLSRALRSLAEQTYQYWELILVDDGSPAVDYERILNSFSLNAVVHHRHSQNMGLGYSLNCCTARSSGDFIAYLPSDDLWRSDHLETGVATLLGPEKPYLSYSKVRWQSDGSVGGRPSVVTATLRSDIEPGGEDLILQKNFDPKTERYSVPSGNPFALVQVMHRRYLEGRVRWREREEVVSDNLELDMWRALLREGARFECTRVPSSEWTDHPEQHHKIISGRGSDAKDWRQHTYGLSAYKQFYGIPDGTPINWQPAHSGIPVDERLQIEEFNAASQTTRDLPNSNRNPRLRILIAGGLGFNADRIRALLDSNCELRGLWMPDPHFWETAGPLPFSGVPTIPSSGFERNIREYSPDVIYGLLNWNAIPFLVEVQRACPDIPFVFHFKESPFMAIRAGYWSDLLALIEASSHVIFSSFEMLEWFRAISPISKLETASVIDGDLPSRVHFAEGFVGTKISDLDGHIHTVSVGRTLIAERDALAERSIHLHVYGHPSTQFGRSSIADADQDFVHFHGAIEASSWQEELSRYDAGWMHTFESLNQGDIRFANWDDLNTPARLGTYAVAGIPVILRANSDSRTAVNALASRIGFGVSYNDLDELHEKLELELVNRQATQAMLRGRREFFFESHLDRLLGILRSVANIGAG